MPGQYFLVLSVPCRTHPLSHVIRQYRRDYALGQFPHALVTLQFCTYSPLYLTKPMVVFSLLHFNVCYDMGLFRYPAYCYDIRIVLL